MTQLARRRVILAKIESSYGVDPTPSGSANAIQVRGNLTPRPIAAEQVGRDLIRPYLANSEQLNANVHSEIDFEVEVSGSGVAGIAPAYGPLLRACALAETATTASASITRASTTATLTSAGHGFANGDSVKVSGATQTEYNGTFTISNVTTDTFDYTVSGSPATPATGTPVIGKTVAYDPISAAFESATIYFNNDGVLHKMTGCRGTVALGVNAAQIPVYKFNFKGIYNAASDTALPTPVYTGFKTPVVANNANTTGFSVYGYSAVLQSLDFNLNNQCEFRSLIGGAEAILITDRKPSGELMFEAPALATKDFFALSQAGTLGALAITHGTRSGYKVKLECSSIDIGDVSYDESQGITMLKVPFQPIASSGNDDFKITVF